jgi:hypothetical protein
MLSGKMGTVNQMIEPPNSLILLVGREEFTPPESFGGRTCMATADCVTIAVISVDDAPTLVGFTSSSDRNDLMMLGRFHIETEGQLSVRDIYSREYDAVGVPAGVSLVTVWGNDSVEPCEIEFQVSEPNELTGATY